MLRERYILEGQVAWHCKGDGMDQEAILKARKEKQLDKDRFLEKQRRLERRQKELSALLAKDMEEFETELQKQGKTMVFPNGDPAWFHRPSVE